MIRLYQFAPVWGLPNASPFCMKLETYLRMAGIPHEIVSNADLSKAPKEKLPYIEDDGKIIADSTLIIQYLKATYGDSLDEHLSLAERAVALAMQRLMEENLYWAMLYSRWNDPENWQKIREAFFGTFPPILRSLIPPIARKRTLKNLHGHGMGRHTPSEVAQIGTADIIALSDFLADKPFFMGDRPTTLDATAYAFLANILWPPLDSPLKAQAEKLTNLAAYCQRMKAAFYDS